MPTTSATTESSVTGSSAGNIPGEIMLFGVRVVVDSMRKSVSLNNLSQYEQPHETSNIINNNNKSEITTLNNKDDGASGYASADDVVPTSGVNRERKRGVPWTEEEHKVFLMGLQKVGKGDWRGISRNFVKTRTPTQVASHAQKYFLRRSNLNRRRRRSSLFDITTDTVTAMPKEAEQHLRKVVSSQSHSLPPTTLPQTSNMNGFAVTPTFPLMINPTKLPPAPTDNLMEKLALGQGNIENNTSTKLLHPVAIHMVPYSTTPSDLNLNLNSTLEPSALSLGLSMASNPRDSSSSSRHSVFPAMSSFSNGDSIIRVA